MMNMFPSLIPRVTFLQKKLLVLISFVPIFSPALQIINLDFTLSGLKYYADLVPKLKNLLFLTLELLIKEIPAIMVKIFL